MLYYLLTYLLFPNSRLDLVDELGGGGFSSCEAVGARDWRIEYVRCMLEDGSGYPLNIQREDQELGPAGFCLFWRRREDTKNEGRREARRNAVENRRDR